MSCFGFDVKDRQFCTREIGGKKSIRLTLYPFPYRVSPGVE